MRILQHHKILLAILLLILASRLFAFLTFGLLKMPDSGGYVEYADYILATPNWNEQPQFLFRMVGFPYLISLLKMLSADLWVSLLAGLQFFISLVSATTLYFTSFSILKNQRLAGLVTFLYGFSILFFLDLSILTDSLTSHMFTIAFCLVVLAIQRFNPTKLLWFFAAGLLLATCFTLREGTIFLITTTLPLIVLSAYLIQKQTNYLMVAAALILYFLPLISVHQMVADWNEARTGERFITTGSRTVYTYALMEPYLSYFPEIFSGQSELDRAFRNIVTEPTFAKIIDLNDYLQNRLGWSEHKIIAEAKSKYLQTLTNNPLVGLYIIASNIKPNTAISLFQPTLSLAQMTSISQGHFDYWRTRFMLRDFIKTGDPKQGFALIFLFFETLVSLVLFCIFMFGMPIYILRKFLNENTKSFLQSNGALFLGLGLIYVGFWLIHALVHLEARYHAGANFILLIGSIYLMNQYKYKLPSAFQKFLESE